MNIEEVITKLSTESIPDEVMHLRFIDDRGRSYYYENCDCWGDFLSEYSCPKYVNIPLLVRHDDEIIKWAMSTPLLSEVLMNETVDCVMKNGWILKTGGLWSKWYTAGLFCRSFTEQFTTPIKYVEGMPAPVLYWSKLIYDCACSVPSVHGAFWSVYLDYTQMFTLPEARVNNEENLDGEFYGANEVHSCKYMYTEDKNKMFNRICEPLYVGRKLQSWERPNSCYRISVDEESVENYLLKLYEEL